jgi:hypothetical protein
MGDIIAVFSLMIIILKVLPQLLLSEVDPVRVCFAILKQVLITSKTRAHAQLSVTLLPQAVTQTFQHI